ncbi:MAG TPA: leucyl aminopeptidase [Gaiellaceae bacterium]|nr:leucyl aminopeptidase [Gaiellaceae bacterium]
MQVEISAASAGEVEADVLGVAVAAGAGAPAGLGDVVSGRIARLVERGDLSPDTGALAILDLDGELAAHAIAAAGVGVPERLDAEALRTAAGAVARRAAPRHASIAWLLDPSLPLPLALQARAVVEGVALGAYDPGGWRSARSRHEVPRLTLLTDDAAAGEAARRAGRVAGFVTLARDLANAPPNLLTPTALAARAGELEGVEVEALGPERARELGMGAFLAVGGGSANEPRMISLRYEPPEARADLTLGLVGKAITFDAGGISIKPALRMHEMKSDMAGGAAVIAATGAIAALGLPIRVVAVVASAENLLGAGAFRPGDILTAANGKTIEIVNTDAEGRLVLADALWYAREQGATHLVDLATLTGAMSLALGDLYAGFFSNDDGWRAEIEAAARESGDHAWPFPLHPRYRRYVDSAFADMKNASELREGSPVLAAEFLQEFAGEGPWAHLDIAGPASLARSRGDYLWQKGGTGYGVRLLVELAQRLCEPSR